MKTKWWIAERCGRYRTTVLVRARSRKEAQIKLDAGAGDDINTEYYATGRAKVVREDRAEQNETYQTGLAKACKRLPRRSHEILEA
jgi:hypothetical protein